MLGTPALWLRCWKCSSLLLFLSTLALWLHEEKFLLGTDRLAFPERNSIVLGTWVEWILNIESLICSWHQCSSRTQRESVIYGSLLDFWPCLTHKRTCTSQTVHTTLLHVTTPSDSEGCSKRTAWLVPFSQTWDSRRQSGATFASTHRSAEDVPYLRFVSVDKVLRKPGRFCWSCTKL